jgi:hypothetical protein
MMGTLLSKETNATLIVALSGMAVVLAAKGRRPLSAGRLLSGVLSNPVPRESRRGDTPLPAQRIAE